MSEDRVKSRLANEDNTLVTAASPLPVQMPIIRTVDSDNSSTGNLGVDEVLTGEWVPTLGASTVVIHVCTDQDAATNGLQVQQGTDGENATHIHEYNVSANTPNGVHFVVTMTGAFYRLVYTNGGVAQTSFNLAATLSTDSSSVHSHPVEFTFDGNHPVNIGRTVLAAKNPGGVYGNINRTAGGNLKISLEEFDETFNAYPLPVSVDSKTAFNEILTGELTPIFQGDFSYNINDKLWDIFANGGTASVDSNRLKISTGAAANQSAAVASKVPLKYHPGQGAVARFTRLFSTGVANSEQISGIGDTSNGFFFGYNGAIFSILRRQGGSHEIRTLTVTTKSTTAENITITLDGNADNTVAVTDATTTDVTTTANEIAAHDFSGLGGGWDAHADGAKVIFISYSSSVQTDSYSLSGATTAVGTFAQTLAGVAPTDSWVAQTAWSDDKGADAEILPVMDWTKGNVFQIRYQWLGYGMVSFWVENPVTGIFICVHKIQYANANTLPSIDTPTLPLYSSVINISNTSDIIGYSASMAGFVEGRTLDSDVHHGIDATRSGITIEVPVLTIQNKRFYQGKENRVRVKITYISASTDGTKTAKIRFYLNPTLTSASFSDIDTNNSVVGVDTSAITFSGGDPQFTVGLAKVDSFSLGIAESVFILNPGDKLTITGASSSSTEVTASLNWEELF